VIDMQKMNVQVEILECKVKNKKTIWDEVVGWDIYRLAMYRCNYL
jgi:hypothetical protein